MVSMAHEKVSVLGIRREEGYLYFLDANGDISRAKRAVGGQKRKKTKVEPKKPVAKKAAPAVKKAAPAGGQAKASKPAPRKRAVKKA